MVALFLSMNSLSKHSWFAVILPREDAEPKWDPVSKRQWHQSLNSNRASAEQYKRGPEEGCKSSKKGESLLLPGCAFRGYRHRKLPGKRDLLRQTSKDKWNNSQEEGTASAKAQREESGQSGSLLRAPRCPLVPSSRRENGPNLDSKFMAATAPQFCSPHHKRWDVIIRWLHFLRPKLFYLFPCQLSWGHQSFPTQITFLIYIDRINYMVLIRQINITGEHYLLQNAAWAHHKS